MPNTSLACPCFHENAETDPTAVTSTQAPSQMAFASRSSIWDHLIKFGHLGIAHDIAPVVKSRPKHTLQACESLMIASRQRERLIPSWHATHDFLHICTT